MLHGLTHIRVSTTDVMYWRVDWWLYEEGELGSMWWDGGRLYSHPTVQWHTRISYSYLQLDGSSKFQCTTMAQWVTIGNQDVLYILKARRKDFQSFYHKEMIYMR